MDLKELIEIALVSLQCFELNAADTMLWKHTERASTRFVADWRVDLHQLFPRKLPLATPILAQFLGHKNLGGQYC